MYIFSKVIDDYLANEVDEDTGKNKYIIESEPSLEKLFKGNENNQELHAVRLYLQSKEIVIEGKDVFAYYADDHEDTISIYFHPEFYIMVGKNHSGEIIDVEVYKFMNEIYFDIMTGDVVGIESIYSLSGGYSL